MKKNKLSLYQMALNKKDDKLLKKSKKFTKSIKRIKKACSKYNERPERKAEFLYQIGILDEYDWHVIRNGIIMYEEKQLKRNLERVNRNAIYGVLTADSTGSNVAQHIVEDIDKTSMYPTRTITVEMGKPIEHPTEVKKARIVKVRKKL